MALTFAAIVAIVATVAVRNYSYRRDYLRWRAHERAKIRWKEMNDHNSEECK